MSGPHFYREVRADQVALDVRTAAYDALWWAAADLELVDPMSVRWFVPGAQLDVDDCLAGLGFFDRPEPILGAVETTTPGELWIRADRPARTVARTVLHEAMHSLQGRLAGPPRGDIERDGREAMAQRYAAVAGIADSLIQARQESRS